MFSSFCLFVLDLGLGEGRGKGRRGVGSFFGSSKWFVLQQRVFLVAVFYDWGVSVALSLLSSHLLVDLEIRHFAMIPFSVLLLVAAFSFFLSLTSRCCRQYHPVCYIPAFLSA